MKGLAAVLLVALGVAFSACKDSTKPDPTVSGSWSGTFVSSGTTTTITLVLAQTGTSVSGSGTIGSSAISFALTAVGTCMYPDVSLTLSSTGFTAMNFTGSFANASTITGRLNGSGYVNLGLALTRQS